MLQPLFIYLLGNTKKQKKMEYPAILVSHRFVLLHIIL